MVRKETLLTKQARRVKNKCQLGADVNERGEDRGEHSEKGEHYAAVSTPIVSQKLHMITL
jgi:hypothetical protein